MMPPDQERTSITGLPGPANAMKCTRAENSAVHIQPLNLASNVSLCLEGQMPDAQEQTPVRFSILRQSLRPVTLKVC